MSEISNQWSLSTYSSMVKTVLYSCPPLHKRITTDLKMSEMKGINCVNTFETSDTAVLAEKYTQSMNSISQNAEVSIASKELLNKNKLLSLMDMKYRKVIFLGLMVKRYFKDTSTGEYVFKGLALKDVSKILPNIIDGVYKIDKKTLGNPIGYIPLANINEPLGYGCKLCTNIDKQKEKCEHTYELWGENGQIETLSKASMETYLTEFNPSHQDIYAIFVGRIQAVLNFGDYKITVDPEKIYILDDKIRKKINQLQSECFDVPESFFTNNIRKTLSKEEEENNTVNI